MQSTRIVQRSQAALVLAVCVGLTSPARTWADNPTDRPLVSSSVPDIRKGVADASAARVLPTAEAGAEFSREQVQEAADHLLWELGAALQSLAFTMVNWDLPTQPQTQSQPPPPPETFVPLSVQPPPSLTDDPNGPPPPPPPPPPPSNQSPEPGTLIAGLAGAGAILYRYRRRAKDAGRGTKEELNEKEVELAM